MSKLIGTKKKWVRIELALDDSTLGITMNKIYHWVKTRKVHNGFVVKKEADSNRWGWFCYEDYKEWQGI